MMHANAARRVRPVAEINQSNRFVSHTFTTVERNAGKSFPVPKSSVRRKITVQCAGSDGHDPRSDIGNRTASGSSIACGTRNEYSSLHCREGSNSNGVEVVWNGGGAAEGEREDIDSVLDCLIHSGKNVGGETAVSPADFVSRHARLRRHPSCGAGGVTKKRGVEDDGACCGRGCVRTVAITVTRRSNVSGLSGITRSHEIALGETASANKFVVTKRRVEIRCGVTGTPPARGGLGHLGIIKALGFWPDASVKDPNNDVV
ncbi:hypothetical protein V8G54_015589 [Vigna mungo]|uniref:Uncharacterized protein n=1 Tax=Vigna mungo TaxID=3915 RepID=A0AAQ3S0K2_VIGMU